MVAHRLGTAGDLVRALTFEPQSDQEAADLRLGRLPAHDLIHHLASLLARERPAFEELRESGPDHRERKFSASSCPSGVSTLSGWNWTPSIGSSRWRTPMTSPSGVRAVTSSSAGTLSAASEW